MFLSLVKNPFITGPLGGSIIVGLAYIDAKIKDIKRTKETYIKLFCTSSFVFAVLTYFISCAFVENDDFLDQSYCTEVPDVTPISKTKYTQRKMKSLKQNNIAEFLRKKKYSIQNGGTNIDITTM